MADIEKMKNEVSRFIKNTARHGENLTDTAAIKIKIAAKEHKIDMAYKALGEIVYKQMKNADTLDRESFKDSEKEIDTLKNELKALNAEYAALKEKIKKENKEAAIVNLTYSKNADCERDEEVMTSFNEKRKEGDEMLKSAIIEADNAKNMADDIKNI